MSVKCLICGVEKKCSIVEHLKHTHNINSKIYKNLYPNAKTKSDEEIKKISDRTKKLWSDPKFKEKQIKIRNITHKDPEFRQKMSEKLKKIHKETPEIFSGFTNWTKTDKFKEWVISEERKNKISKSTKEKWQNNEYRYNVISSIKKTLNDGRCKKSIKYREKMSEKISELYSSGQLTNNSNKYKTGKYKSKSEEEFFYSSSYELESMKLFDISENIVKWTNKHGIRIKYYFNDLNRNYIPDFLIEFKNGLSYIIEMKGWYTEEVGVKQHYTLKQYPNYKIFYNLNELEKFINENK